MLQLIYKNLELQFTYNNNCIIKDIDRALYMHKKKSKHLHINDTMVSQYTIHTISKNTFKTV